MGRKPSVRYWPSRSAYCCWHDGVQHTLAQGPKDDPSGPCYLSALGEFKKLLEFGNRHKAGDANTVRVVFDSYLQEQEGVRRPRSFAMKLKACKLFAGRWGELPISEVKSHHATDIVADMRKARTDGTGRTFTWSDGTARLFLTQVSAAFTWAVRQEMTTRNPLASVDKPSSHTRARERVLRPGEHEQILAVLRKPRQQCLRRLVVGLENSGCRPSELANATVGDWREDIGGLMFFCDDKRQAGEFAHKTSAKKDRIILFTGEALAMVRELVSGKKRTELLFPQNNGRPYSPAAISSCFVQLRERTGIEGLVAYTYRHTFATRFLKQDQNIDMLAALMGNTPNTIREHYSHLLGDPATMRDYLERFGGG